MLHETHNLAGYLEGSLPEAARERVERHLDRCAHCRAALATMTAAGRALEAAGRAAPAPAYDPELWSRVRAQIAAPSPRPALRPRWALLGGGGALVTAGLAFAVFLSQPDPLSPIPPPSAPDQRKAASAPKAIVPTHKETVKAKSATAPSHRPEPLPRAETAPLIAVNGARNAERPSSPAPPLAAPERLSAGRTAVGKTQGDAAPASTVDKLMTATEAVPLRAVSPAPSSIAAAASPAPVAAGGAVKSDDVSVKRMAGLPAERAVDRSMFYAQPDADAALARKAETKATGGEGTVTYRAKDAWANTLAPSPNIVAAAPPPSPAPAFGALTDKPDARGRSGVFALRAPAATPSGPRLMLQADQSLAKGELASARRDYQRVLDHKPAPSEARAAHIGLGDAAVKAKDDATAIKEYKLAADIARDADLMVKLGAAYERSGKPADAREAFRVALALSPASSAAKDGLKRLGE